MTDPDPQSPPKQRLLSLDAFRGFDIAAMLLVNMTWSREHFHPQLFHIDWNDPAQGATLTDLVFPWFLFIAGAAIPLSMRSGRGRAQSASKKILIAFRRAVVIYLLGVLITVVGEWYDRPMAWTDLTRWNILQLIGAAYFVCVCVYLLPKWAQISFVALILAGKWALMTGVPWDWVATLADARAQPDSPTGPATWRHFHGVREWVNGATLEPGFARSSAAWFGMAQQFLPCAAIAVLGGFTTEFLTSERSSGARAARAFAFGVALTLLAYVLQWGYDPAGDGLLGRATVPFSKWFFSPAYCLLASGTGAVLYAAFFFVIDAKGWTSAWALRVYGLNAIALYVGAEFTFKVFWSRWKLTNPEGNAGSFAGSSMDWLASWCGPPVIGLSLWVALYLLAWWLVCFALYRKKIFIKV